MGFLFRILYAPFRDEGSHIVVVASSSPCTLPLRAPKRRGLGPSNTREKKERESDFSSSLLDSKPQPYVEISAFFFSKTARTHHSGK